MRLFLNPDVQVAVGTYDSTNHEMLVFAGHAQGKRETNKQKTEEELVVSLLVSQIDSDLYDYMRSCHTEFLCQTLTSS
jgi:hypothetical protein